MVIMNDGIKVLRLAQKLDIIGAPQTADDMEKLIPKILKMPHGFYLAGQIKAKMDNLKIDEDAKPEDLKNKEKADKIYDKQQEYMRQFLLDQGLSESDYDLVKLLGFEDSLFMDLDGYQDKKYLDFSNKIQKLQGYDLSTDPTDKKGYHTPKLDKALEKADKERQKKAKEILYSFKSTISTT